MRLLPDTDALPSQLTAILTAELISELTLVLLSGMDGTGELFSHLRAALPAKLKVVVISYPAAPVLSYAELTCLAEKQIPQNMPYLLLGESFSGPIAIALASRATAHLRGLILSCTFVVNPRPKLAKLRYLLPAMRISKGLVTLGKRLLLGAFSNAELEAQLLQILHKIPAETLRARLDEVMDVNYIAQLSKVSVPILYLKGREDHLVPASASKLIGQYAENFTLVEIDAPHLLLQVASQESVEAMINFMLKQLNTNTA